MLELVETPEDRFSRVEAQIIIIVTSGETLNQYAKTDHC